MNELELVLARFRQSFEKGSDYGPSVSEGSWHGPTLMESLEGVDHTQATARPIKGRHTIWELVNHCAYWMNAVTSSLRGMGMVSVGGAEDWPGSGETTEEWAIDIARLREAHWELIKAIEALGECDMEKRLGSHFGARYFEFTYRKMLHGISDHNLYHAGQVSLLKKK